jgi:hypothetical protein
MWFYIFLLVFALLFVVWVSRTNLFRHWRAHNSDPGQQGGPQRGRRPVSSSGVRGPTTGAAEARADR